MKYIFSLLAVIIITGCSSKFWSEIAYFTGVDLEDYGISLVYNNIPEGLKERYYAIDFGPFLKDISEDSINIEALNTFTMGSYREGSDYTHLVDPTSKFKDTWFGVYIIFDDSLGKGSAFMLDNSDAQRENLEHIQSTSMTTLPKMDQKFLVWSTHQNQDGYDFDSFRSEFYFNVDGDLQESIVTDSLKRNWKRVSGSFNTIAALTDTKITDMEALKSIRVFTGIPSEEVYAQVKPWHPITIHGIVYSRYFDGKKPFWAVVYLNGTEFTTNGGVHINTAKDTDAMQLMEHMFYTLDINVDQ